mgnify:CR=1 FL=1
MSDADASRELYIGYPGTGPVPEQWHGANTLYVMAPDEAEARRLMLAWRPEWVGHVLTVRPWKSMVSSQIRI